MGRFELDELHLLAHVTLRLSSEPLVAATCILLSLLCQTAGEKIDLPGPVTGLKEDANAGVNPLT